MQHDFVKATATVLDQQEAIVSRTLNVASENINALFALTQKVFAVRNLDDAKELAQESAKVARLNAERAISLVQENAQSSVEFLTKAGKDIQDKAQEAVKATNKKR